MKKSASRNLETDSLPIFAPLTGRPQRLFITPVAFFSIASADFFPKLIDERTELAVSSSTVLFRKFFEHFHLCQIQ